MEVWEESWPEQLRVSNVIFLIIDALLFLLLWIKNKLTLHYLVTLKMCKYEVDSFHIIKKAHLFCGNWTSYSLLVALSAPIAFITFHQNCKNLLIFYVKFLKCYSELCSKLKLKSIILN